jgi:hypothetical protein
MIFCFIVASVLASQMEVKSFNVSLDDPPDERWKELVIDCKEEILRRVSYFESVISYFDRLALAQALLRSNFFTSEILLEMKAASMLLGIDLDSFFFLNLNELFAEGPTFLVITDKLQAILGKNIENSFENFRTRLVKVKFFRDGKILYETLTEAGSFVFVTAMKPSKFAVTFNKRNSKNSGFSIWNVFQLFSGRRSACVSVRWAMENLESFEDVLVYLSNIQLVSSSYFSVVGIDRAVVLSRDAKFLADLRQTDEEKWFLTQSDSDHWLPGKKERDSTAISRISDIGQEYLNEEMIFGLLELKPTLSKKTIGSIVVNPGTGYWFSVAREF